MAAAGVESLEGYKRLLARAGFGAIEVEDLSDWWRRILRERLRKLGGGRFSATTS